MKHIPKYKHTCDCNRIKRVNGKIKII